MQESIKIWRHQHNLDTSFTQVQAQSIASPSTSTSFTPIASGGHDFSRVAVHSPQAKLTVSQPNDPYEQEADRVADQVMRMQDPGTMEQGLLMRSLSEAIQRKCAACDQEDEELMRKASGSQDIGEGAIEQVNRAVRSGGQPLDRATRDFMEPRFGHDFSQVRIHADSQASNSAQAIQARAYAIGQDVVFASGQYAPGTDAGKRLLAHELTHVVQQTGGVQTKLLSNQPIVQRECLACEEEKVQRSLDLAPSQTQLQAFWDDEEKAESDSASGGGESGGGGSSDSWDAPEQNYTPADANISTPEGTETISPLKKPWGCEDVRCNVYPVEEGAKCPERESGSAAYIYSSFKDACDAAKQDVNDKIPRGCNKRHCNCNTKCTQQ